MVNKFVCNANPNLKLISVTQSFKYSGNLNYIYKKNMILALTKTGSYAGSGTIPFKHLVTRIISLARISTCSMSIGRSNTGTC